MNTNTLKLVAEFHQAFSAHAAPSVDVSNPELNKLRTELLSEELSELRFALAGNNPVGVLDALTDLQYVLDGAFLAFGLHHWKDAAFAEVHRSNMSKLGADGKPIMRADGKILKGPNYSPPDLAAVLALPLNGDDPAQLKIELPSTGDV